uniref:Uncharacterized protein n=1 Tax=Anopheles epiroticus TaxID=199890 RepID=A0A182NZD9_9DIPT
MVTHRKPPFYRMCNDATLRRLPIFAVLFLNLFIDLTTIDGHVLPRPLVTSSITTTVTTTTTIPSAGDISVEHNFSTAGSENIGSITSASPSRSVPFDVSILSGISAIGSHASSVSSASESTEAGNQHTGTETYSATLNNTASGRVLVVVPENFAIGQLHQGFRNFVKLLHTNRSSVVSDSSDENDENDDIGDATLLDSLIQFRSWRDMVAFERWLEDPAFTTVLYMSDEGDSFIGYCDSLSTHLSAIYRKSVLFWPCPRMK